MVKRSKKSSSTGNSPTPSVRRNRKTSEGETQEEERVLYLGNDATVMPVPEVPEAITSDDGCQTVVDDESPDDDVDDDDANVRIDRQTEDIVITKVKKRKNKSPPVLLSDENEKLIATWLETKGHFVYDKGNRDYKKAEKTAAAFETLGKSLQPPVTGSQLRTWFYSIRSRFGRLTTEKSGQAAPNRRLTDRERWILDIFSFLRPHIVRQRKTKQIGLIEVR